MLNTLEKWCGPPHFNHLFPYLHQLSPFYTHDLHHNSTTTYSVFTPYMQKHEDLRIWAPHKFGFVVAWQNCGIVMFFLFFSTKFGSVLIFNVVLREVGSHRCKNILHLCLWNCTNILNYFTKHCTTELHTVYRNPLVKIEPCSNGEPVCRTEYESVCSTKQNSHQV